MISFVAVWTFFILEFTLLCLTYVILYFLPYGFITEKSFTQMPVHIIIAGNASNFIVFSIPIVVSVVVYLVLTKEVQRRRQLEQEEHQEVSVQVISFPPEKFRDVSLDDSSELELSCSVQDLPYPLNMVPEDPEASQAHGDEKKVKKPRVVLSARTRSNRGLKAKIEGLIEPKAKQSSAEIEAALRSMKTNLMMLLMFFVNTFILFIPSVHGKIVAAIVFEAILKLLLPTVTTVSNFGPVKDVVKLYLENLKGKLTAH